MPWRSKGVIFYSQNWGKNNDAKAERERHDKAVEQLEAAQAVWSQKESRDWILSMKKYKKNIMLSRRLTTLIRL